MKTTNWFTSGPQFNNKIGSWAAWLVPLTAVSVLITVGLRYLLGIGAVFLQELALYLFSAIWWVCAPATLSRNGHVRVDIFYRQCTDRTKRKIDCLGHLLLLIPSSLLLVYLSYDYVHNSWALKETSTEPGGLPWVYVLKTLLILAPSMLALQGLLLCFSPNFSQQSD